MTALVGLRSVQVQNFCDLAAQDEEWFALGLAVASEHLGLPPDQIFLDLCQHSRAMWA